MAGALEGDQLSSGDVHPHALLFPFPLQGHLTPMMKLAEVLALTGAVRVTLLTTDRDHRRLLGSAGVRDRLARRPGLHLRRIPESFPEETPLDFAEAARMIREFDAAALPRVREMLCSGGGADSAEAPPVTCVVVDALLRSPVDAAEEMGVPIMGFRTSSACSFWADLCIPDLVGNGVVTFHDGCDLDELLGRLPGTESFLRRRDIPDLCRAVDADDLAMQILREMAPITARYRGHIFNTAEFAEPSVLAHIRRRVSGAVYPLGPLHGLLQTLERTKKGGVGGGGGDGVPSSSSTSLLQEDRACIEWLDSKPPASVVYVSFGSIALLRREHLLELWHGLVNSGHHFLLVVRPGLVVDVVGAAEVEGAGGAEGRAFRVEWAPQEEVLAHPAVGCFLTHSGWNSTVEGLWAGVPMACWPNLADQFMNRRMVAELWKTGVEIEGDCDRAAVERAVREVMGGERGSAMRAAAAGMSEMARACVQEGGSSYASLEGLVRDIRAMGPRRHQVHAKALV